MSELDFSMQYTGKEDGDEIDQLGQSLNRLSAYLEQAIGELKKVVWPTAATTRQYFVVVLVFVLFIMAFVAGLDALFGWLLLLWLA